MYRYILRESCSQFDSLPLTYLTNCSSWPVILPLVLDALVSHVGAEGVGDSVAAATLFSTACGRLAALRESLVEHEDSAVLAPLLDQSLATMLRGLGLAHFLRVIPISPKEARAPGAGADGAEGESAAARFAAAAQTNTAVIPRQREWLVPFLAEHCKDTRCDLGVFDETILPIASACNQSSLSEVRVAFISFVCRSFVCLFALFLLFAHSFFRPSSGEHRGVQGSAATDGRATLGALPGPLRAPRARCGRRLCGARAQTRIRVGRSNVPG